MEKDKSGLKCPTCDAVIDDYLFRDNPLTDMRMVGCLRCRSVLGTISLTYWMRFSAWLNRLLFK